MNASTHIPNTVELRPTRLAGLIVGAAALAAVITWALLVFAVNSGTNNTQREASSSEAALSSLSQQERQYVEGIAAMSPDQLVATYGVGSGDALVSLSGTELAYVEGIAAMSPEQLAAAYGREVPGSLSPSMREYVQGLMAMTPEQLAAAYGRYR